jgi:hypothetical protein
VGPSGSSAGAPESAQTISCEGLDPLRYPASVPVVEVKGWAGLLLDWTNDTYYLALGHYNNRIQASVFGLGFNSGYLVLAHSPSVPASWLPPGAGGAVGFYFGRASGYFWDFEKSWGVCEKTIWASAYIGSEMNLALEIAPFGLAADVSYDANLGVGFDGCLVALSVALVGHVGAGVQVSAAHGELNGSFSGHLEACGKNLCLVIGVPTINVNIVLWDA